MHRFLLLIAASSLGAGSLVSGAPSVGDPPPNVVVVLADDLGYGDLGCFGAPLIETPRIDQMAAEGARLTSFYVHPSCSPTRAAMMTGLYPQRTGVENPYGPFSRLGLDTSEVTLAEVLRDRGYATGCFGKWHLGDAPEQLPTGQGFDVYVGSPWGLPGRPTLEFDSTTGTIDFDSDPRLWTRRWTEEAISFIQESAGAQQPFFVLLSHHAPHNPATPHPDFQGVSADGREYGDCVEEIDWSTGAILDALDAAGVGDDTLVVFFSDNGPANVFGPYQTGDPGPLRGWKGSTFEGGVRVPGVARWPAEIPPGTVTDTPIQAVDLLPTIAAVSGATLPAGPLDGRDVTLALRGLGLVPEPIVYYTRRLDQVNGVRQGRWKLHLGELYDLVDDIGETTDVAAQNPSVVTSLEALRAAMEADLATNSREAGVSSRRELTWRADEGLAPPGPVPAGVQWSETHEDEPAWLVLDFDADESFEIANTGGAGAAGPAGIPARSIRPTAPSDLLLLKRLGFATPGSPGDPFSIELWFRLLESDPSQDLVLLEVGEADRGLSLTVGDGGRAGDDDAPGRRDDLRFTIGGTASAAEASLTVDLPDDADTRFVDAVVTYDGAGEVRLYLRGVEAARVEGVGPLDWAADLGWTLLGVSAELGGSSLAVDPAFPATTGYAEVTAVSAWDRGLRRTEVEVCHCRHTSFDYCHGTPNSTGETGRLELVGSFDVREGALSLHVSDLPPFAFGRLFGGTEQTRTVVSAGDLCLGGDLMRIPSPTKRADADGTLVQPVVPDAPAFGASLSPGTVLNFQYWYRDGAESNFTNAAFVLFCL